MFELSGNYGSLFEFNRFQRHYKKPSCSNTIRQCRNSIIHSVYGGTESATDRSCKKYMEFCNKKQHIIERKVSLWGTEYHCRRAKSVCIPVRVGSESEGVSMYRQNVGAALNRSLREHVQYTTSKIQQSVVRSQHGRRRCIQSEMGRRQQFHKSTASFDEQGVGQNNSRQGDSNIDLSCLASPKLVSEINKNFGEPTIKVTKNQIHLRSSVNKKTRTNEKSELATASLEGKWKSDLMIKMGWSHRAANYYLKFLAPSTLLMYNNYINMFHAFCIENQYSLPYQMIYVVGQLWLLNLCVLRLKSQKDQSLC